MSDVDQPIERDIVTGLIVSTEYLQWIRPFWKAELLDSPELRRIAAWCLEYYDEYRKAPDRYIEPIYMDHLKYGRVPKKEAEDIGEILNRISDDFEHGDKFNFEYLKYRTVQHANSQNGKVLAAQIEILSEQGRVEEADELRRNFTPPF
jgi:hypothetical protein